MTASDSNRVRIASDQLAAVIDPLGAELISLTDAAGREYITDANPAFWSRRAPLLFPIVGAVTGGHYRLDGKAYPMRKHGFARGKSFTVTAVSAHAATFRLEDDAETREVYPFAFALELEFALLGPILAMTATVRNPGDGVLPFSFGFHPAFAWPLPGGAAKADHAITFAEHEPEAITRIDAEGLVVRTEPSPVEGRHLALEERLFEADAMIWRDLRSRALSYGAPGGTRLEIAFPDTAMLGIWQMPGAGYICIEPWAGIADPAGYSGDFRDKPGICLLAPGGERRFRMDVTVAAG